MCFSVSVKNSEIEYSGSGLSGLFANKNNIFNYNFIKMIKEIIFFYNQSNKIDHSDYRNQTLAEFLKSKKMSEYFINFHIIPMVSAIWSIPTDFANEMPMSLFLNFFQNHGLFKIKKRPQWYTVSGRSKNYVARILQNVNGEYFKNYEIKNVSRKENGVRLYYGSSNEYFDYDQVVFAVHANEILTILNNPTENEKRILKSFKYKKILRISTEMTTYCQKEKKLGQAGIPF